MWRVCTNGRGAVVLASPAAGAQHLETLQVMVRQPPSPQYDGRVRRSLRTEPHHHVATARARWHRSTVRIAEPTCASAVAFEDSAATANSVAEAAVGVDSSACRSGPVRLHGTQRKHWRSPPTAAPGSPATTDTGAAGTAGPSPQSNCPTSHLPSEACIRTTPRTTPPCPPPLQLSGKAATHHGACRSLWGDRLPLIAGSGWAPCPRH
jgi:hypothetical protein